MLAKVAEIIFSLLITYIGSLELIFVIRRLYHQINKHSNHVSFENINEMKLEYATMISTELKEVVEDRLLEIVYKNNVKADISEITEEWIKKDEISKEHNRISTESNNGLRTKKKFDIFSPTAIESNSDNSLKQFPEQCTSHQEQQNKFIEKASADEAIPYSLTKYSTVDLDKRWQILKQIRENLTGCRNSKIVGFHTAFKKRWFSENCLLNEGNKNCDNYSEISYKDRDNIETEHARAKFSSIFTISNFCDKFEADIGNMPTKSPLSNADCYSTSVEFRICCTPKVVTTNNICEIDLEKFRDKKSSISLKSEEEVNKYYPNSSECEEFLLSEENNGMPFKNTPKGEKNRKIAVCESPEKAVKISNTIMQDDVLSRVSSQFIDENVACTSATQTSIEIPYETHASSSKNSSVTFLVDCKKRSVIKTSDKISPISQLKEKTIKNLYDLEGFSDFLDYNIMLNKSAYDKMEIGGNSDNNTSDKKQTETFDYNENVAKKDNSVEESVSLQKKKKSNLFDKAELILVERRHSTYSRQFSEIGDDFEDLREMTRQFQRSRSQSRSLGNIFTTGNLDNSTLTQDFVVIDNFRRKSIIHEYPEVTVPSGISIEIGFNRRNSQPIEYFVTEGFDEG